MAQIKEMPVHIREYYKAMKVAYTQKKEDALKEQQELMFENKYLQRNIRDRHEDYLKYNINLSEYPEFINNEYKNGQFLRMANGAYINKSNDYELTSDLFDLLKLAKQQKRIVDIVKEVEFYDKLISFNVNDYIEYIRYFFNLVHKKLVLEGYAYHFEHHLGDVFVNRVKNTSKRKKIDYKATKLKKAEIVARGGRLYDKAEAEFCEQNGIEYDGEDGRVYLELEYFYEIVLAYDRYIDQGDFTFTPQNYRAVELRGYTNDQIIEGCEGDKDKICELPIDLKLKVTLCNKVDKMLYTNFVRNENQTSYKYTEASR